MNAHLTLCWSVKGGQGTTVTAAALALAVRAQGAGVDLIDHPGGDLTAPFKRRAAAGAGPIDAAGDQRLGDHRRRT